MGKMFSFITGTFNPVAGECPFDCSYCWAKSLIKRYNYAKYQGPARLDEKAMRKIPDKGFIFVQDMSDISTLQRDDAITLNTELGLRTNATYLDLTKDPNWYYKMICKGVSFPENVIFGATIETDKTIKISKAPTPLARFNALEWLAKYFPNRIFISIEPIMDFNMDTMVRHILKIRPWAVAVGYDNYHNNLPEPPLEKTRALIDRLRSYGITVYEKTLREAWR